MGLNGDLATFSLGSILQLVCDERKTGVLTVYNQKKKYQIILNNGNIVYALGSENEARIGTVLLKTGIISSEQLQQGLVVSQKKKQALGKVLVDSGVVSIEKLKEILYKQAEEILFQILIWNKGEYSYEDMQINFTHMVLIKMDSRGVILEAARRIDEMSVFKKLIPSEEIVFYCTDKFKSGDFKLKAEELNILTYIDGKRSIKEILLNSTMDEFMLFKTIY
jgi:hypothetical protein